MHTDKNTCPSYNFILTWLPLNILICRHDLLHSCCCLCYTEEWPDERLERCGPRIYKNALPDLKAFQRSYSYYEYRKLCVNLISSAAAAPINGSLSSSVCFNALTACIAWAVWNNQEWSWEQVISKFETLNVLLFINDVVDVAMKILHQIV